MDDSPTGKALAQRSRPVPYDRYFDERIFQAVPFLLSMHIDENTFALASTWEPPMAPAQIMSRVVRPSIFILQRCADPDFTREFSDKMFPSGPALKAFQSEIRKVLQILVRLS